MTRARFGVMSSGVPMLEGCAKPDWGDPSKWVPQNSNAPNLALVMIRRLSEGKCANSALISKSALIDLDLCH